MPRTKKEISLPVDNVDAIEQESSTADNSPITETKEDESEEGLISNNILEFVKRASAVEQDLRLYIYRETGNKAQTVREAVGRINITSIDDIPDEHSIGMEYGSGKYLLMLYSPESGPAGSPGNKSWRVRIGLKYDEMRRGEKGDRLFSSLPVVQPKSSLDELKQIAMIFKELMQGNKPENNTAEILSQNYVMMNQVYRQSFLDNMQMMRELAMNNLSRNSEQDEIDDEEIPVSNSVVVPDWLRTLSPLLPYAKMFLNSLEAKPDIDPAIKNVISIAKGLIDASVPVPSASAGVKP